MWLNLFCWMGYERHRPYFVTLSVVSNIYTAPVWQGSKKVSFTAHGKLYLACTSPKVISTSLKKKIDEQDWLQFFCNLNSPQKITCWSGRLRTEFTSQIAKSISPRLLDTTFFACRMGYSSPFFLWTTSPTLNQDFFSSLNCRNHSLISQGKIKNKW